MPADSVKSKLKMLFVIDKSGSNQDMPNGNRPGTDIDGTRRYTPIKLMMEQFQEDDSVYFGLVNFSTAAREVAGFTNDKTAFQATVEKEHNPANMTPPQPSDKGWTDIKSALNQVYNIINTDITNAKKEIEVVSSYYVVFFISDGAPYVEDGANPTGKLQPKQEVTDLVARVLSLEQDSKMYVDSIQLHTGYYYNTERSNEAYEYMRDMSYTGLGDFYEFSAGQLIDFSQFSLPTRNVKHVLRDILLADLNSIWIEGKLFVDSDGDGIPDKHEEELGSDPNKADSDENGVSDGVELYALTRPCKDDKCAPSGAQPFLNCRQYITSNSSGGQGTAFIDLDNDGLNNCEEHIVLKSKADSFDSNEDWIPDFLAFRNNIAFMEGSTEVQLDPDGDGVNNYNELKLGTPIKFANDRLIGFKPFKYELELVSDDADRTCYTLEVNDVKMLRESQKFRLFLLENTAIIDTKRFMRSLDITLRLGETTTFTRDDFGEGREE
jgi:uncharacterized protein YegL